MLGPEVRDLCTYIGGWGWVTGLLMGGESLRAVMASGISKAAGALVGGWVLGWLSERAGVTWGWS